MSAIGVASDSVWFLGMEFKTPLQHPLLIHGRNPDEILDTISSRRIYNIRIVEDIFGANRLILGGSTEGARMRDPIRYGTRICPQRRNRPKNCFYPLQGKI